MRIKFSKSQVLFFCFLSRRSVFTQGMGFAGKKSLLTESFQTVFIVETERNLMCSSDWHVSILGVIFHPLHLKFLLFIFREIRWSLKSEPYYLSLFSEPQDVTEHFKKEGRRLKLFCRKKSAGYGKVISLDFRFINSFQVIQGQSIRRKKWENCFPVIQTNLPWLPIILYTSFSCLFLSAKKIIISWPCLIIFDESKVFCDPQKCFLDCQTVVFL